MTNKFNNKKNNCITTLSIMNDQIMFHWNSTNKITPQYYSGDVFHL